MPLLSTIRAGLPGGKPQRGYLAHLLPLLTCSCRCGPPTTIWPATGDAAPTATAGRLPALRLCGPQPGRSVRGGALQTCAGLGRGQQLPAPERAQAAGDRLPLARRRGAGGLGPATGLLSVLDLEEHCAYPVHGRL